MSFLTRSLIRAALGANAAAPRANSKVLTVPSFFAAWFTSELSAPLLLADAVESANAIRRGALRTNSGRAGLVARAVASGFAMQQWRQAASVGDAFAQGFGDYADLDGLPEPAVADPKGDFLPFFAGSKKRRRRKDVTFAEVDGHELKLDVYEPLEPPPAGVTRPCVIYVHGGAWLVGDKREQGVPMLNHLAANGYVGFNVNYRLSPKVKAPDHVIDVKRAIAWVREHAEDYGADPDFIAISGGSAGGHLAALAALTSDDPAYQPGFEEADCSVQAAIPFYGVYDLTERAADMLELMDPLVFPSPVAKDPELHRDYSPVERVHSDAPPFLIVQGSLDVLVPAEGARRFAQELRAVSGQPVLYTELEGAQHAFEIFMSPRTRRTLDWVEKFLDATVLRFREATEDSVAPVGEGEDADQVLAATG
ncbi:MAG: alpha/beta hydrolase [Microthrixaceae bacterium]|nr:alpha/beta hydrolase [Microthrixaceae bacterium]